MSTGDEIQLVVFRVGTQHFGLDIFQVERILRWEAPAPLPQASDFLEGMLSYGGGMVPLIDLRKRLSTEAPVDDDTRIMVLEWDEGRLGLVVDAVLEVKKVVAERITPPPRLVKGLAAAFINGVVEVSGRTVVLLALGRLLTSDEQVALNQLMVEAAQ